MKQDINIDMWYGDKFEPKKYGADAYFHAYETIHGYCYTGNIYDDNDKIIGDYQAMNSTAIEDNFLIAWAD